MGVVRLDSLTALMRTIVCEIPQLEGHVCVGQAPSGEMQEYPHLVIDPIRWRWEPAQQGRVRALPGGRTVYNVGAHECTVQLSLAATTPAERAELEQRVLDIFIGAEDAESGLPRPGVVVVQVTDDLMGGYTSAFELDADEWDDSKAFDRILTSIISVTAIVPALVTRCGEYTIRDLRLGVTQELATPVGPAMDPPVEVVRINDDGTLTPL